MCGILGYVGKSYNANKLEVLFLQNEARGKHSTGYYSDSSGIVKQAKSATDFLCDNRLPVNAKVFLGHTRYATQGSHTDQNAHPFEVGNTIGVHNGVISNDSDLSEKYGFSHTVDSEAIFQLIEAEGYAGIGLCQGSASVAFIDKKFPNELRLYRRTNPLYYGYVEDGMYFSSLEKSLRIIGCTKIKQLKEGRVFFVSDAGRIYGSEKVKANYYHKPRPAAVRSYSEPYIYNDYYVGDGMYGFKPKETAQVGYRYNASRPSYHESRERIANALTQPSIYSPSEIYTDKVSRCWLNDKWAGAYVGFMFPSVAELRTRSETDSVPSLLFDQMRYLRKKGYKSRSLEEDRMLERIESIWDEVCVLFGCNKKKSDTAQLPLPLNTQADESAVDGSADNPY